MPGPALSFNPISVLKGYMGKRRRALFPVWPGGGDYSSAVNDTDVNPTTGVVEAYAVGVVLVDPTSGLAVSPASSSAPAIGYGTFATGQTANIGATATQIVAARAGAAGTGRGLLTIENLGTTAIYLGGSSAVTTANGVLLPGVAGASITIPTTSAVYGITASGTGSVSYTELY